MIEQNGKIERNGKITISNKDFIFFDLDGTLVDSGYAISVAWGKWANRYSIKKTDLEKALGGTSIETIQKLLPSEKVQAAWVIFTNYELESAGIVREVKGARELLSTIPINCWGLVTSSKLCVAEARLISAGLPLPTHIIAADNYKNGKPLPEPYEVALKLVGKDARSCLSFEDSISGVASASAAGVDVVGITTYSSSEELKTKLSIKDFTGVRISFSTNLGLLIDIIED